MVHELTVFPDPLQIIRPLTKPFEGLEKVRRVLEGISVFRNTPRPPIGTTPHEVVHRQDKLRVRYYAPRGPKAGLPVVLVPSLINGAMVLDLEPGRSLVEALAEKGHPVYLVDWGIPGPEDADEDVGYVLLELLHRSMARIVRHAKTSQAHLFGYCMGGTLTAMYAALRPEYVASLSVLAAPVRFSEGGRFRDLVLPIDIDEAINGDGLVPVSIMKPAFQLLDPMGNWTKYLAIEQASHDPDRLRSVMARERWLEENVPVAGAFVREFVENGYKRDRLLEGGWIVRGEAVRLEKVACRTLVVACDGDFITPKEAALPLVEAIGADRARSVTLSTGHIGVVVSGAGPKTFYPLLDQWFRGVSP